MRRLVTIRRVRNIKEIPNADAIECAVIDGWECVVKKGEFNVGDLCVYFEIDSLLPLSNEAFLFLNKGKIYEYEGKAYVRLKTIKLRGQLSQGLALKLDALNVPESMRSVDDDREDLASMFGVIKYEVEDKAVAANAAGKFPAWIPKTDQERIQNVYGKYSKMYKNMLFQATVKLDGSSCTVFCVDKTKFHHTAFDNYPEELVFDDYVVGVCSRNLLLKYNPNDKYWKAVLANEDFITNLVKYCRDKQNSIAVQGELMGPGIQGNREKLSSYKFYTFDIYDIDRQIYIDPESTCRFSSSYLNIEHVPVLSMVALPLHLTIDELTNACTKTQSINNPVIEGIVFKCVADASLSFKVINPEFLLKEDK